MLPEDDRMIKTCRSILNKLQNARCNDKDIGF